MITSVGLYQEPKRKKPWLVQWWTVPDPETGKQRKRSKSFKYRRDASAFQTEKQGDLNSGAFREQAIDVTLGRLLAEFQKTRLASLSYKSQECYANTIGQLKACWGKTRPIRGVDTRLAESFMATRKRLDGRPGDLSSWSLAQHLKHCRAIFGAAVDWGYVARNPFVPPDRRSASALRVKGKSGPWHHITPAEFRALLHVAPSPRWRTIYWLLYGCGLRAGEVYNLTLDRIDLDGRRIHIKNRTATAEFPPFTVKADERSGESKERVLPIPEPAMPDVTEAYKLAFKAGGFIALTPERHQRVRVAWRLCRAGKPCGGRDKYRPWQNRDMTNNVLREIRRHVQTAGLEFSAPLTLHTFRKSFAQNHADAGTPPRTLAQLLGHSDANMTLEFYSRVTDANQQAAAATIDRLLAADFHCTSTGAVSEGVA